MLSKSFIYLALVKTGLILEKKISISFIHANTVF